MAPDKQDCDLTDLPGETEKWLPWFLALVYIQILGAPTLLLPTLPHILSGSVHLQERAIGHPYRSVY